MDFRAVLTTPRRTWPLLVVPVIVGLLVAVVVLALQTPRYRSTANVYVSVGGASSTDASSREGSAVRSATASFAALAEQPYVLYAVRQRLDLPLSSEQIAKEMTTAVEGDSSIISISVLDESAKRATLIANGTAEQLPVAAADLSPRATDGTQAVKVTVVKTAVVPDSPAEPNRPLGLVLGVLAGLLVGAVLLVLRQLLARRGYRSADALDVPEVAVVGRIPRDASIAAHPLVMVDDPAGASAESIRRLQLETERLCTSRNVVTLGVVSAVPSEGRSIVAANLALAFAQGGSRVALVDADLRRPRLHAMFGIDNAVGLTEVLLGRADVFDVVQPWGAAGGRIAIVPGGSTTREAGELLQSPRLHATLERLAEEADVVIVDGPSLAAVPDSGALAGSVDAVLLVESRQRRRRSAVPRAVAALHDGDARVLGIVATMERSSTGGANVLVPSTDRQAAPSEPESSGSSTRVSEVEPLVERAARERRATPAGRVASARTLGAIEQSAEAESEESGGEESLLHEWFGPFATEEECLAEQSAEPGAVEQDEGPVRSTGRPTRVPGAHESDSRMLRRARQTMSEEELRIVRSFSTRSSPSSR